MSLVGSKLFLYNGEKQKNVRKMGQFQENISCKLQGGFPSNMLGRIGRVAYRVYGGQNICEFDRNWPSGYRD